MLREVYQEIQLSEDFFSCLAVSNIVLNALVAECNDESSFDLLQLEDITDESKGTFCSCSLVDSEDLAEETGLLLLLTYLLVVVVDFVLVDTDDSLLLDSHIVDFDHSEFLILRSFT